MALSHSDKQSPEAPLSDRPQPHQRTIRVACIVCGQSATALICTAEDVAAQLRFLRTFHAKRRRRQARTESADRTEFTQDYRTEIVMCRTCGLLYRNPRPSAAAVVATYVEDRYGEEHLATEFLQQRRWAEAKVADVAARIQARSPSVPVVVEVGSFIGGFLAAGQARGWAISGVDPGKEVTDFCRKKGLPVFCGTLKDAPIATGSADAVVIWNTFDQLPAPDGTLAAARRLLHEQGLLAIRVPNGQGFQQAVTWRKRLVRPLKGWLALALAWNNLLAFPYVYGYTVRTLDELVSRHGFQRMDVVPDTLIRLSNQTSTRWARWEEALVKWCCRCASKIEAVFDRTGTRVAPWLDVYYRVSPTMPNTSITVSANRLQHVEPNTTSST